MNFNLRSERNVFNFKDGAYHLPRFTIMQEMMILTSFTEIQKENWGKHAFFKDNSDFSEFPMGSTFHFICVYHSHIRSLGWLDVGRISDML